MSIAFSLERKTRSTASLYNRGVYPPAFSEEFKESVRERDGRCCALCAVSEERLGQHLNVHHINYTKYTVGVNCISLCRACHEAVHNCRNTSSDFKQNLYRLALRREGVETMEQLIEAWREEEHAC